MNYEQKILSYIYQLRILTIEQINKYIFLNKKWYCYKIVKELVDKGLLEKKTVPNTVSCYFITNKGINYLKVNGIIKIGTGNVVIEEMLTASQIRIKDQVINHQLSLNNFVLSFEEKGHKFEYFDEKFTGKLFKNIRPDGIIKTSTNLLFLEMDMATERKSSLESKWNNYRKFMSSNEAREIELPIKVLFILNKPSITRTFQLRRYIYEGIGELVNEKFNFYINTEDKLQNALNKDTNIQLRKLKNQGYYVSSVNYTHKAIPNHTFTTYIALLKESNKVLIVDNIPMDFLVDDYTDENTYTYIKYRDFPYISSDYEINTKRKMKYLIITNSIEDAIILARQGENIYSNCYFTTPDMLNSSDLYSSLFKIEITGEIVGFNNSLAYSHTLQNIDKFTKQ